MRPISLAAFVDELEKIAFTATSPQLVGALHSVSPARALQFSSKMRSKALRAPTADASRNFLGISRKANAVADAGLFGRSSGS